MTLKLRISYAFLAVLLLIEVQTPASGFGMMGGNHGGNSAVAEILAAGLITRMLMNKPKAIPVIHHAIPHIIGGYRAMPPRHPMPAMYAARMPVMNPYMYPIMPRPRYNMMNHALMTQASKNQAITKLLNEEIRALEAHESMLEASLARVRQGSEKALNELLNEEETIPAAALLLADLEASELLTQQSTIDNAQPLPPPEVFQVAASEPESRFLLPRIVRHFVQRLLRRGRQHP